jgi:hypothetical protein
MQHLFIIASEEILSTILHTATIHYFVKLAVTHLNVVKVTSHNLHKVLRGKNLSWLIVYICT